MKKEVKNLLKELKEKCSQILGNNLTSLVLFGSVSRGEFRKDSDIDILIICKKLPKSIRKRVGIFLRIEDELKSLKELERKGYYLSFSPILKSEREAERISPLYLDMTEDAKILFDRDNFFTNILERLRIGLKKHGAKRVWIGKKWYWDLKPDYKFGEVIEIE